MAWEAQSEGYVNAIVYSMDRQEGTWNVDPPPKTEVGGLLRELGDEG